jgi:hypothetical protein
LALIALFFFDFDLFHFLDFSIAFGFSFLSASILPGVIFLFVHSVLLNFSLLASCLQVSSFEVFTFPMDLTLWFLMLLFIFLLSYLVEVVILSLFAFLLVFITCLLCLSVS